MLAPLVVMEYGHCYKERFDGCGDRRRGINEVNASEIQKKENKGVKMGVQTSQQINLARLGGDG